LTTSGQHCMVSQPRGPQIEFYYLGCIFLFSIGDTVKSAYNGILQNFYTHNFSLQMGFHLTQVLLDKIYCAVHMPSIGVFKIQIISQDFMLHMYTTLLLSSVQVKVKLSLCLTKCHTTKMYWGSGSIAPHILNLGTRWR
jgi:hypothetical protein